MIYTPSLSWLQNLNFKFEALRREKRSSLAFYTRSLCLKAHANRRNIVGQQHPTLWAQHCCDLFASVCMEPQQCWHLFVLVAHSLKPVKLLTQQVPTFLLFCDRQSVAQHLHGTETMLANVGLVKTSAHARRL